MTETRTQHMKKAWDDREQRMGPTRRAVLFKRFPFWLNESIHRRHTAFVVKNIPADARRLLDVGCGYGRISREIRRTHPAIEFQGVDLCAGFAAAYAEEIGPCFNGPIQEFRTDQRFDVIVIVTCLMYLAPEEQTAVLERLWSSLSQEGCLVCIEPASEILTLWRRRGNKAIAAPTGDTVHYFERAELKERCCRLPAARLEAMTSISLVPLVPMTALHYAIAVRKGAVTD